MDHYVSLDVVKFITSKVPEANKFEKISEAFDQLRKKYGVISIGDCLSILLEESLIRNTFQKCLAVFLLWDLYKSEELYLNPHLECIFSTLTCSDFPIPNQFKLFMHNLMLRPERALYLTQMNFLQILNSNVEDDLNAEIDWSGVESALLRQRLCMPSSAIQSISNIIPDPEKFSQSRTMELYAQDMLKSLETLAALRQPLGPEMIRLQPPPLLTPQMGPSECATEEFVWINPPTLVHEFHWDSTMGSSQSAPKFEINQLASISLTTSLTVAQREELIRAIKENNKIINYSPENFSNLVSENPAIAIEYLVSIKAEDELDMFLSALLEMDLNVGLLEVINQTSSRRKLPNKFVLNCIPNLLTKCQNIEDKNTQMRIARLVCLFTMSWLRNKTLNINNSSIFTEIESFCLMFCKVKEANNLYRQVKNLETGLPADKNS